MDANRNRGKWRAGIDRQCQARMESGRPPTTIWVVINLSSAVRNSAATLCSDMILGTRGWAAVIVLIRRSSDLRWPKADVEGELAASL